MYRQGKTKHKFLSRSPAEASSCHFPVASFTCSCRRSCCCNSVDIGLRPSTLSKYTHQQSPKVPDMPCPPNIYPPIVLVAFLLADATLHKFSANEFNLRNACGWVPKWKRAGNGWGLPLGSGGELE